MNGLDSMNKSLQESLRVWVSQVSSAIYSEANFYQLLQISHLQFTVRFSIYRNYFLF